MSRSYRKPYFTQGYKGKRRKDAKQEANHEVRRKNKAAAKELEEETIANGKAYKKAYQTWSICDWRFFSPDSPKARRK